MKWIALATIMFTTTLVTESLMSADKDDPAPFLERKLSYTGGEYDGEVFEYLVLPPKDVEPDRKYPLVLFLHGAGERGDDNRLQRMHFPALMAQDDYREKYPCYLVVPQCRTDKRWVDAEWTNLASKPMAETPSDQMKMAVQALRKSAAEFPIDRKRVYLTGLSMGGFGSWELAMRHPDWFAAVVPICGGGDETYAKRLIHVPIWTAHGDADTAVSVERTRRMVAAIREAGGTVKYTELPGVGHNSWTPTYTDADGPLPWMFQHVNDRGALPGD